MSRRWTFTAGCRWCGATLTPAGDGASTPVQRVAVTECLDCGATFAIRVELVAVRPGRSESRSAVRGRAYRARRKVEVGA